MSLQHDEGEETEKERERWGTWLVERDVAVLPDTGEEELNTAGILDLLFVSGTLANKVLHRPVEDIHLLGRNINMREQMSEPVSMLSAPPPPSRRQAELT